MNKVNTPFGEIQILLDGKPIPYSAQEGSKDNRLWSHVLARFQIEVNYKPDGEEHSISCVVSPKCSFNTDIESGEYLECLSFYNDQRYKMSIGLEGAMGYNEGEFDYDEEYLSNGISFLVLPSTKTEHYRFRIAWIDDVGWDDPIGYQNNRADEPWDAVDFFFPLDSSS